MPDTFLCNEEVIATKYTTTVTALIVLEGIGIGIGAIFMLVCIIQLVFLSKLKSLYDVIQLQVSEFHCLNYIRLM